MRDRVIKVISQVLEIPVEAIGDDASPETIESWDSLKHMNLVLALEDEFGIRFSDETIVSMLNVGSIVDAVAQLAPHVKA